MRRISFIAATGLALVLAACGGSGDSPPAQPPAGGGGTTQAALPSAGTYPIHIGGNSFGYLDLAADGSYASNIFRAGSKGGGVFTRKGQLKQVTPPAAVRSAPGIGNDPQSYAFSFWGMVTLEQPVYDGGSQADFYLAYRPRMGTAAEVKWLVRQTPQGPTESYSLDKED